MRIMRDVKTVKRAWPTVTMARGSATGLSISTLSGTARPVVSAELPAGMVSRISARYKTGAKSRGVERKIGRERNTFAIAT